MSDPEDGSVSVRQLFYVSEDMEDDVTLSLRCCQELGIIGPDYPLIRKSVIYHLVYIMRGLPQAPKTSVLREWILEVREVKSEMKILFTHFEK